MPGFRLAATHYNDDLPTVAAREMGDANRWVELVWLNGLVPPYITDDVRLVAPGVLRSGALIKIPAPVGMVTDGADSGQVFERDCQMVKRQLQATPDGDLSVVSGFANLRQQLSHRIVTPRGQATRHAEYGCLISRLVGKVNGPTANMLGAQYVNATLKSDYRVSQVQYSRAIVDRDSIKVTARVIAIDGGAVDVDVPTAD